MTEHWFGSLPQGWRLSYLKFETKFLNGAPFKPSDWSGSGIPIIRIENLNGNEDFNCYVGELDEKYRVRQGDLLFSWSGNIGTSFGPYLWDKPGDYYLNQHIFKLVDFKLPRDYLYWLLKGVTAHIEEQTSGIIGLVHVTKAELGRIAVPVAPPHLQPRISHFLGKVNLDISEVVNRKLRLVDLLEEQKRAIISRAVTRGINPDAPMKHSGLDWFPEIPAHWDIRRNIRLFRERNENGRDGLPVLIVSLHSGVSVGEDQDEDGRPRRLIEDRTAYKFAARGDIAYNMMRMWQGAVGVAPEGGLVSPAYVVARSLDGVSSAYYVMLFRTEAYKNEINRNSTGIVSDRNRLYWDGFKEIYSPVPPLEEQSRIVCALDAERARIDGAIAKAKREMELIEEFRTTLISEVVTGKRDIHQLTAVKEPL